MFVRIAATLLLLLCFRAADAAPSNLAIVSGAGTVLVGSTSARWEFGTRSLSDASTLTHLFFIRNSTKKPLAIARVAVSCDCVQALIAESSTLPVTVAAGQTVPVLVTVTMRRLVPGPFSKSVWVYLHGAGRLALRLEMHGTVRDDSPPKN